MKIGVKFCGNCNPLLDAPRLVSRLKARLGSGTVSQADGTAGSGTDDWTGAMTDGRAGVEFVSYSEPEYDVLLLLNGCGASCAEVPEFTGPVVRVDGLTVNRWPVEADGIENAVLERLLELGAGG